MGLLLDTHIFLWFISGDAQLPGAWREGIQDAGNEVYVSVVSLRLFSPFDSACHFGYRVVSHVSG
jgi:hypothetical protein